MKLFYRMEIVENRNEGGFVVSYPDLPGCITCGETVEHAVANAVDAKRAWIEAALEAGLDINEPDSLEDYSGQFKLGIPRSLLKIKSQICYCKNGDILAIGNRQAIINNIIDVKIGVYLHNWDFSEEKRNEDRTMAGTYNGEAGRFWDLPRKAGGGRAESASAPKTGAARN